MACVIFENVSKTYARQSRQFFWRFLLQMLTGREPLSVRALDNVSFSLRDGEGLAVVGPNGAGKSTLLALAAGLLQPDRGRVHVTGRVVALLELGSGFHPDLTGAENLRVNAALLGLTRRETNAIFDQVVEFAELRDFINEPLRTYSHGMILRLGFAIAVHAQPEILLIDEVMAVGDQRFQHKCLRKISELRQQGKILICVSQAPAELRPFCDYAIWLERGHVVQQGPAGEVLEAYQRYVMNDSPDAAKAGASAPGARLS